MLVHIEVQGDYDKDFAQRMYVYHYRIYDRYRRPVVSLAVLGDQGADWRPGHYDYHLWGCRLRLEFPVIKLRDYRQRWQALEASDNPFAVMVMAHLSTQATRDDPEERLRWKLRLVRYLYERGYGRQDILELFRFIDWLLTLPAAWEQRFQQELEDYEASMSTPYITSIERRGIEKGMQQGMQQGEATLLKQLLIKRFGSLPETVEQRLAEAESAKLERWAERLLEAPSLDAVFEE